MPLSQGRLLLLALASLALSACLEDRVRSSASATSQAPGASTNLAPVISGSPPPSVVVGQEYVFTPTASDPEGASLSFTVANKPAWLDFNTLTGSLRGTPSAAHVGTISNITIAVSDGVNSVNLAPFSFQVAAAAAPVAGSGTATLSWQPPTQRIDGSPLNGLAGYKVHVGQTSRSYSRVIDIAGSVNTRYTVTGLGAGRWYFAVSAYDNDGLASDFSAEVSKAF
jgi:hypothetical protein